MNEDVYNRSIKADIIPIINAELQVDEKRLFALSVKVINELFNVLQAKSIPMEKLRDIVTNNSTSDGVLLALEERTRTPTPVDVPEVSSSSSGPTSVPLYSQDSIKADIIPVIQNYIDVSSEKLFSISVETLNEIFGHLESGAIPNSEIESIINSATDSSEISSQLKEKTSTAAPSTDSYKNDLIIGILFNVPESSRAQIEGKLREIENTEELVEISQLALPELQSKLGIEAQIPQRYDEKADLRAGILVQLPPTLRGVIGDRIKEIEDIDRLYKISQLNYVQIQQELGLAPQSVREIPAEYANPVDTASRSPDTPSPPTSSAASPPRPAAPPPQSEQARAQVQQRREKNKENIKIIQKMAEKIFKVKISEGEGQTPEATVLIKQLDILLRTHPPRVETMVVRLKNAKDKNRFKAYFSWYIYSQRIEEIETYVEHWQGQVQGIGGFRAAINVSRFDPIVEHISTKEIEGIIIQCQKALQRVHSSDINVRARGVEDIKQISNYLLQKAH